MLITLIYENLKNYIFFKQLRKLCQDVYMKITLFLKTKATIDTIKYCCT